MIFQLSLSYCNISYASVVYDISFSHLRLDRKAAFLQTINSLSFFVVLLAVTQVNAKEKGAKGGSVSPPFLKRSLKEGKGLLNKRTNLNKKQTRDRSFNVAYVILLVTGSHYLLKIACQLINCRNKRRNQIP